MYPFPMYANVCIDMGSEGCDGKNSRKNYASMEDVKERITMLGQFTQQKIDEDNKN